MRLTSRMLAILCAGLAPALAILVYNQVELREERREQIGTTALQQAALIHRDVTNAVEGVRELAAFLARSPAIAGLGRECPDELVTTLAAIARYAAAEIRAGDGTLLCGSLPAGRTLAQAAELARPLEGAPTLRIGTYVYEPDATGRYLPVATRLPLDDAEPQPVLVVAFDLDWLGAYLTTLDHPVNRTIVVADREAVILARYPDHVRYAGDPFLPSVAPLVYADTPGNETIPSFDDLDRLIGYIPPSAPPYGIWTSVGYVLTDLTVDLEEAAVRGLVLILAGLALAVALALVTGAYVIQRPTAALLAAAKRWRAGDVSARVDLPRSASEFHDLASAYNEMAEALEERQNAADLLMREMNHRVKNTLATVLAVVHGSARSASSVETYRAALVDRIDALARVQTIAARDDGGGKMALADLFRAELRPYDIAGDARFALDGPPVVLAGETLRALALAVHELATNAAKYGALGSDDGRVRVAWTLDSPDRLIVRWTETGGPPPAPDHTPGFGTRLLRMLLERQLDGRCEIDMAPEGLRAVLEARLGPGSGPGEV